jgi:hypothetical protein
MHDTQARYDALVRRGDGGANEPGPAEQERLIFPGRRSETARLQFKDAREERITLNHRTYAVSR